MIAADLATRLSQVRHRGDRYSARCPAHQDHSPSLTFRDGQEGLLVHCWAGCAVEEIVSALGLRVADLFRGRRGWRGRACKPDGSPQREWQRVWTHTLHHAAAQGQFHAAWDPIFARADLVRVANQIAAAYRARVTTMSPDAADTWDWAEAAALFEDDARLVELEADELTVAASRAGL